MIKSARPIILIFFFIPSLLFGQETSYGPGYQTLMVNNPAMSGGEGDGVLRLSYLNFFPGNNYDLHSVYLSYDGYFPSIHGGACFYLSDDYMGGIVNDLRSGLSYAYYMQAGKDLFVSAGLTASIFNRGYNFSDAVLPDMIDPVNGVSLSSGEILTSKGHSLFDVGAGFTFFYKNIYGGFAVNHLTQPALSSEGRQAESLKRKLILNLSGNFKARANTELNIRPLFILEFQDKILSAGLGSSVEGKYLSVNALLLSNSDKFTNIQTGVSIKTGKMLVYYNYRFNIASENKLVPFSLLHQTGVAFSLNNVDKRKVVKTINFPKL